jgi:hypothetical protein
MKKIFYTILAASALFLGACKKDDDNNPGGNDTYQPFSVGSEWTYRNEFTFGQVTDVDTTTSVMSAVTKTLNNKVFHLVLEGQGEDADSTFVGYNNNVYSTLMYDEATGEDLELAYFDASKAAGQSWTSAFTYQDGEDTINAQLKSTIVEKGISKSILNKNYKDVIHSKIEVQIKTGNTWTTVSTFEFYAAKNIGIIGMYNIVPNVATVKAELLSYKIK